MNLLGRFHLRTLCLLGLFASLLPSAPADTLTLKISPGRAVHTFGIIDSESTSPQMLGSARFVNPMTPGTLGGWLELEASIDPEEPFDLYDFATGETLSSVGPAADLRQGVWNNSGSSSVYFMIPWELHDRQFALTQLEYGTTYIANKSTWHFTPNSDIDHREATTTKEPMNNSFMRQNWSEMYRAHTCFKAMKRALEIKKSKSVHTVSLENTVPPCQLCRAWWRRCGQFAGINAHIVFPSGAWKSDELP
jgi:hypothetical protein